MQLMGHHIKPSKFAYFSLNLLIPKYVSYGKTRTFTGVTNFLYVASDF